MISYTPVIYIHCMESWPLCITLFHCLFSAFLIFYGVVFPKNRVDSVYLLLMFGTLCSWTLINGECLFSYYVKKIQDPDYVAGMQPVELDDFKEIDSMMGVLFNNAFIDFFKRINILSIINFVSIYLVMMRNGYGYGLTLGTLGAMVIYTLVLRYFHPNVHEEGLFLFIQEFFKAYFFFLILFVVWHILRVL